MRTGFFKIAFSISFLVLLYGCGLFQHTGSSELGGKDSLLELKSSWKNRIAPNSLVFNNIEGRIRNGGQESEFNGSLKYVSDSLVVISINSILNIEIFRIYIGNDSVFLLDRTKREFEATSFKMAIKKYSEFLTIPSIGDLLLGNMMYEFKALNFNQLQKGKDYSKYGVVYKADSKGLENDVVIYYVLDNNTKKPIEFSLQSNEIKFHILYSNYDKFEDSIFPRKVEILVKSREIDFLLNMEIGTLKRRENLNTHIFIPDGYKRKS